MNLEIFLKRIRPVSAAQEISIIMDGLYLRIATDVTRISTNEAVIMVAATDDKFVLSFGAYIQRKLRSEPLNPVNPLRSAKFGIGRRSI